MGDCCTRSTVATAEDMAMKGGKQGRPRRASGASGKPKSGGRGSNQKSARKQQRSGAPRKGVRRKTYGGRNSGDDS
jgi:hypothetical protein